MATLVVFEFPSDGPWGPDMTDAFEDLALDIAGQPGLVWKVWTEAPERGVAGGVYLFETEEAAEAYSVMHAERLESWGVRDIDARISAVNLPLSDLTRAVGGRA